MPLSKSFRGLSEDHHSPGFCWSGDGGSALTRCSPANSSLSTVRVFHVKLVEVAGQASYQHTIIPCQPSKVYSSKEGGFYVSLRNKFSRKAQPEIFIFEQHFHAFQS